MPETDTEAFRSNLRAWYRSEGRDLPWRRTVDPYAIWVSEIMLQQTQVATVLPYYERWMNRFPAVEALANANEQDVLALWQGLGYYRRCKNLLLGSRTIAEFGFPKSFDEWLKVPGVGRYTAAALASICLGKRVGVVDGNVERVFSRVTGSELAGSALHAAAWEWAQSMVDPAFPAEWNQAVMELGATVCTPLNPSCDRCPVSSGCVALQRGIVADLPKKPPKKDVVSIEFAVWIPYFDGLFGLMQIQDGPWWRGMWEFPKTSCDKCPKWGKSGPSMVLKPVRHTVTHHRVVLRPTIVFLESKIDSFAWFSETDLHDVPLPSPQRRILGSVQLAIDSSLAGDTKIPRRKAAGR